VRLLSFAHLAKLAHFCVEVGVLSDLDKSILPLNKFIKNIILEFSDTCLWWYYDTKTKNTL